MRCLQMAAANKKQIFQTTGISVTGTPTGNKNWLELMHMEELPQKCRAIYLDVEDMETGEHIFLK